MYIYTYRKKLSSSTLSDILRTPGMCRFPKQYPAVPAMTWPPFPALWTSLMRPPVPVVAPLNGATPGGTTEIHVDARWNVTKTFKRR